MDNFKLDLTKLTPVEEKDRVKGNWYFVSDDMTLDIVYCTRFHSGKNQMLTSGIIGASWVNWFLIPPSLPGFPKSDLPELIKLPLNEWSYSYSDTHIVLHRTKRMPSLTIPSGTRAEQIEAVRKLLNELQTKPNE